MPARPGGLYVGYEQTCILKKKVLKLGENVAESPPVSSKGGDLYFSPEIWPKSGPCITAPRNRTENADLYNHTKYALFVLIRTKYGNGRVVNACVCNPSVVSRKNTAVAVKIRQWLYQSPYQSVAAGFSRRSRSSPKALCSSTTPNFSSLTLLRRSQVAAWRQAISVAHAPRRRPCARRQRRSSRRSRSSGGRRRPRGGRLSSSEPSLAIIVLSAPLYFRRGVDF